MTEAPRKRVAVEGEGKDIINALPRDVVNCILELLPVHDAAKTSILSREWRHIWASLPYLVLNDFFCQKLTAKSKYAFKETVDLILLQHIGDIVKFDLDVSGLQLSSYDVDIHRWMLYVTRNGVKELKLNMTEDSTYKLPSYIFNCPTLTHLKLFNCIFKLPNSFLGFQTLTVLELEKVTFVPAIEFYAINVPLLVKFTLVHCDGSQYLNIVFSSELKSLVVHESHYNLDLSNSFFKKCKFFTYLYLVIDNPIPADKRLTLEKLLSTPTLETLSLGQLELELLNEGAVPKGLPCTLNCLWHLKLGVNFNELNQTSYTLELIKSSPNIRKLEIWDNTTVDIAEAVMKYLDTPACLDRTLNKLEVVSIYFFTRSKAVLSFVKLLFAHAPSLSRMSLKPEKASSFKEELNVAKELMCLPRVSPKAKLFYHADEDLDDQG